MSRATDTRAAALLALAIITQLSPAVAADHGAELVQRLMGTLADRHVVALDLPSASSWSADSSGEAADVTIARACRGSWVQVGSLRVLELVVPADRATAAGTTLPDRLRPALQLAESLTPEQMSAAAGARPLPLDRFGAEQLALLSSATEAPSGVVREGQMPAAERGTTGSWMLRVLARPLLRYELNGHVVGQADLLAPCWHGMGYESSRLCRVLAGGGLEPASMGQLVDPSRTPGWVRGSRRDLEPAEAVQATAAAALPTDIGAERRCDGVAVVPLGELPAFFGVEAGRMAISPPLRNRRLAFSRGRYRLSEAVAAAACAYGLSWRVVDGVLLLAEAPGRAADPDQPRQALLLLEDLVSEKLRPVAVACGYEGLVLPYTWFVQGHRVDYAELAPLARAFVEDVWWRTSYGRGSSVPAALDLHSRETAGSYYERNGAGPEDSPARQQSASELRQLTVVACMGYRIEKTYYDRSENTDMWLAKFCGEKGVAPPKAVAVRRSIPVVLYPDTFVER